MLKDRNYYRSLPTSALREETRYRTNIDWEELAVALIERLDDVRQEAFDEVDDVIRGLRSDRDCA
jgi:hypothetical protein